MTMRKISSEGIPCTYCGKPALPGTEPPVCKEHFEMRKNASADPSTLKELSTDDGSKRN